MSWGRKQLRIDPDQMLPGTQATATEGVGSAGSSAAPKTSSGASQIQSDHADLSSDGVTYTKLSSSLASVPEIRQERVAPLRQALQNGSYQVSNQQIAKSLQQDYLSPSAPRQ